jgi:hypothetical protein
VVQLVVHDAGQVVPDAGAAVHAAHPRAVAAAAPDDSGALNLVATGDADVFVDGRHVGTAPVRGVTVRPGEHTVRFTCIKDANRSAEQRVDVPAFSEVDVEHACQ